MSPDSSESSAADESLESVQSEAFESESGELDVEAEEMDAAGDGDVKTAKKAKKKHFRRTRRAFGPLGRVLAKIPHPPWNSKRGILVLFLLFGGFGAVAAVGGTTAVHFSETAAFCGMCHTMAPELKAYNMSAHKEVTCGECHVNPGLGGFVKAKANGSKQLLHILTGNYPTPIAPPSSAHLPPVAVSCLECHEKEKLTENGGPVKLVLRPRYKSDETNTRETLAVLLRPAGLGESSGIADAAGVPIEDGVKGVHWHIDEKVTYTSGDEHGRKIDLVEMESPEGTKQYIAGQQVAVSTDVKPDIERLKTSQTSKVMDCLDCHNRVGHAVPSPDRSVDKAIAEGKISTSLPFIKRDSVALLNGNYPTLAAADKAIGKLRSTYAQKYPLVLKKNEAKVTEAIEELKVQYRLVSTPAMKVQAKTYPDNLGHQGSLGCFRCHDNAHFLVVKGKITNKKIPSECSTCHTFPSIGEMPAKAAPADQPAASAMPSQFAEFPLGARPAAHKDKLYTFNHKNDVKSTSPAGTTCAACHTKSYCANCHNSGAVKVKHDSMLYNHADSIKASGGTQSCAYCHLPVYCEACHKGPILDTTAPPAIHEGKQAS